MTDAPERIRVAQDAEGFWTCREAVSGSQEYVRADLAIMFSDMARCPHCDGTGDVHRADGEWLGECDCGCQFRHAYDVEASPSQAFRAIQEQAARIAALEARNAELERELEKVGAELEEKRARLFPYADITETCGMSWNGFYLIGDSKSIAELRRLENRSSQLEVYRQAYDERIKTAETALADLKAEAAKVVEQSHAAIAEYYRYQTGGETRGSYDGKPERNGLWKAMYAARTFHQKLTASEPNKGA